MWLSEPVTLQSVRITGLFLTILSLVVTYKTARLYLSIIHAFIPVAIFVFFEAMTGAPDFVQYGSEIFSVFLFSVVTYLIAQCIKEYNFKKLCASLFIAGIIPFAKLQSAPLVLYVGIFVIGFEFLRQKHNTKIRRQNYLYLAISATAPAILILMPVLITGNIDVFWKSYIAWGLTYKSNALNFLQFIRLLFAISTLSQAIFGQLILTLYVFATVLLFRGMLYKDPSRTFLIYAVGFIMVSIYAVIAPGRMFPHYLSFLLPGIMFINIALLSSLPSIQLSQAFAKQVAAIVIPVGIAIYAVVRIISVSGNETMNKVNPTHYPGLYRDTIFHEQNLFDWLPTKNNYMLVWGWMSQWYVFSGKIPASRESQTELQIRNIDDASNNRDRMLSDLRQSEPSIIIDAVVPGSFEFTNNRRFGIKNFSELENIVTNHYRIVNMKAYSRYACPALYIKVDDEKVRDLSVITPDKITATAYKSIGNYQFSPDRVYDNSVFEQCGDSWLLPDHTKGMLQMTYKPSKLNEIWLLNTMGIQGARSTLAVNLKIYIANNEFVEKKVRLHEYPAWTKVKLPETVTSTMTQVEIKEYYGNGGGLNEIKLICNKC